MPSTVPMSVTGVVMISSPGSGLTAPTAAWMAPVPESVVKAYLTPWTRAKASSNSSTLLAAPQPPSIGLVDDLEHLAPVLVVEEPPRAERLRSHGRPAVYRQLLRHFASCHLFPLPFLRSAACGPCPRPSIRGVNGS